MKPSTISIPVPAGPIEQAGTRRPATDTSRPVFAPDAVPGPSRPGLAFEPLGRRSRAAVDAKGDYAGIPFGGVRHCLNAAFAEYELRIVLATLFDRYAVQLTNERSGRDTPPAMTSPPRRPSSPHG